MLTCSFLISVRKLRWVLILHYYVDISLSVRLKKYCNIVEDFLSLGK